MSCWSRAVMAACAASISLAPTAFADEPPPPPAQPPPPAAAYPPAPAAYPPGYSPQAQVEAVPPEKRIGIGYKLGNGLGFVGGDLIISVVSHLALELQASYANVAVANGGRATGYGLAPALHGRLKAGQVSTPYVALGLLYINMSTDGVTASGTGFFANVGYEWRWASGLGILLGAGVARVGHISATDGLTTLEYPGGTFFNIESGIRYMFF